MGTQEEEKGVWRNEGLEGGKEGGRNNWCLKFLKNITKMVLRKHITMPSVASLTYM